MLMHSKKLRGALYRDTIGCMTGSSTGISCMSFRLSLNVCLGIGLLARLEHDWILTQCELVSSAAKFQDDYTLGGGGVERYSNRCYSDTQSCQYALQFLQRPLLPIQKRNLPSLSLPTSFITFLARNHQHRGYPRFLFCSFRMSMPSPTEMAYQEQHMNDTRVPEMLVIFIFSMAIAHIAVFLRFMARRVKQQRLLLDDWVILASSVTVQ